MVQTTKTHKCLIHINLILTKPTITALSKTVFSNRYSNRGLFLLLLKLIYSLNNNPSHRETFKISNKFNLKIWETRDS